MYLRYRTGLSLESAVCHCIGGFSIYFSANPVFPVLGLLDSKTDLEGKKWLGLLILRLSQTCDWCRNNKVRFEAFVLATKTITKRPIQLRLVAALTRKRKIEIYLCNNNTNLGIRQCEYTFIPVMGWWWKDFLVGLMLQWRLLLQRPDPIYRTSSDPHVADAFSALHPKQGEIFVALQPIVVGR